MNWFDQLTLLLTGLVAIYLIIRFIQDIKQKETTPAYDIFYIISFAVLLVAGLLLIFYDFEVLARNCVVIVAYLIPLCLSLGLVYEFHRKAGGGYLIFGIIGLILIAVTRFTDAGGWATFVLAFFHSVAGLLIFFIPIFAVKSKKVIGSFIWVTIGGALIGIGGISLAFLKAGSPILSAELIFTILSPLLLIMSLAFAMGFVKKIKNPVS